MSDGHFKLDQAVTEQLAALDRAHVTGNGNLAALVDDPAKLIAVLTEFATRQRQQIEGQLPAASSNSFSSLDHLLAIVDNASAVIYVKDANGRYLLHNRQFEELFHLKRGEYIGKTDYDLFPVERADAFRANDKEVLGAGEPIEFEELAPHDDGLHTYISLKFPLFDAAGNPEAVCGISTDITDRKRAEEELRLEQRWLRRLLDLQEHERQLLTYEIHDGPIQYVTGALMRLEAMRNSVPEDEFQGALTLLRRTIEELRRLISGLRPPVLDEMGPVAAIEHLVHDYQSSSLQVTYVHDTEIDRLDSLVESALFRIAQEALTNVLRHSESNKARVELMQIGGMLRLTVRDWGVGFQPDRNREQTFGLEGIRERARLLQGKAIIESQPGKGTLVMVELPIPRRDISR